MLNHTTNPIIQNIMYLNNRTFPNTRLRRTRIKSWSRKLVQETQLNSTQLILPIFIIAGTNKKIAIKSMPNVYRLSIDLMVKEAAVAAELEIQAIALFPVIDKNLKDNQGSEALNPNNLVCQAIKAIKKAKINIGVITDVALDPYTNHGHDGIIIEDEIANDETVEILTQQALIQVEAGCDIIAPSDMQDGRIQAIRTTLEQHKYKNIMILSYAAKYASNFYGPFRDALDSNKNLADKNKKSYQQDYHNSNESIYEATMDAAEGADIIMVKPAHTYLDIIYKIKNELNMPTFAYQVSGEYSMLELLAQTININPIKLHHESLVAIKRAGADAILTYNAINMAKELQNK